MAQYIDKDAVVAELEKKTDELYDLLPDARKVENGIITISEACNTGKYTALESFREYIDTLEVKELDVWHEASETPKGAGDKEILVQFSDSHASVLEIDDWEYLNHQTKWAYLKDLI